MSLKNSLIFGGITFAASVAAKAIGSKHEEHMLKMEIDGKNEAENGLYKSYTESEKYYANSGAKTHSVKCLDCNKITTLSINTPAVHCGHCNSTNLLPLTNVAAEVKVRELKCKVCLGTLEFNKEDRILFCPYCDYKEIIPEDPEVARQRIRSETYKEAQRLKNEHELKKKQLEYEKEKRDDKKSMIMIIMLISLILLCILGMYASDKTSEGEIRVPSSAKSYEGENYKDVMTELQKKGFTNIETEELDDLITGIITKEGEVESVSIDGVTDFEDGDRFPDDAEVRIIYHTFPSDDDDNSKEENKKEKEKKTATTKKEEKAVAEKNSTTAVTTTAPVETTAPLTTTPAETTTKKVNKTLKAENNEDLAEILTSTDFYVHREFVEQYKGKTIEFDGCIAYVAPHGSYKTRYDFIIYCGDYVDENTASPGAEFKFENLNYSDFKFSGDNKPDSVYIGLNVHIKAKVIEHNDSDLILLKPVSTEAR